METVAIVGRPNVGKSTLFNRIVQKNQAITGSVSGLTRDRVYGLAKWKKFTFNIIDTGGITLANLPLSKAVKIQSEIAIEEAGAIIFVIDGRSELTVDDVHIAKILYRKSNCVFVAVNKTEGKTFNSLVYKLGFKKFFNISATHNIGIEVLLENLTKNFKKFVKDNAEITRFAIVGKPNVGKSSLMNALTGVKRSLVSPLRNTTRDVVTESFTVNGKSFLIYDTAGMKRRSHLKAAFEVHALIRAFRSLSEVQIAVLVLDSTLGVSRFDGRIISYALERNKPLIVVYNKCDLLENWAKSTEECLKKFRERFPFAWWIPLTFVSALSLKGLDTLKSKLMMVKKNSELKVDQTLLKKMRDDVIRNHPPKQRNKGILKIKKIVQTPGEVPTFLLTVNNKRFIYSSYERYLKNQFRKKFGFQGVPVVITLKTSENNPFR